MGGAKKIGGGEKFAVHAGGVGGGVEGPTQDPKLSGFGVFPGARYQMDATPGRHTQGFGPSSFSGHVVNASGLCLIGFGFGAGPAKQRDFLNAVSGGEIK